MPDERDLKNAIEGKQLPSVPTNGSQPQQSSALSVTDKWLETYGYSKAEIYNIAEAAAKANIFKNTADAAKGYLRILWGLENGLTPISSLNDVWEYNGRFSMYADAIVANLAKRGVFVEVDELTPDTCTAHLEFNGETVGKPVTFTTAMAKAMDLMKNPGWSKDTETMNYNKAVARLNKRYGRRFWQTTVEVREDIEDWQDVQTVLSDPATKAIASAGRRRKVDVVKRVEDPKESNSNAESVVTESPATVASATTAPKPKTMPAKERTKLASPAQKAEFIKACEDAELGDDVMEPYFLEAHGINDNNFDEKFTVEVFQATMLHIQGIIEGVR